MTAGGFKRNWGVFLDRDGTITEEVGYVNHVSRLSLLPGAAEGIRLLNDAGVPVMLATNQAGVARGYFDEELLKAVLKRLEEMLAALGARLDALYYCPHHPTAGEPPFRADCDCRKPKPGMLLRGAREFGLDLGRSYVVGDKISDVAFAKAGGAKGILVTTGYGLGELTHQRDSWRCEPCAIVPDFYSAARWILEGI
ncbi:MAG: HAD family hydrolase [Acidobacteria bacterium]|jgi:D-glycero-D-manno-heptose 1,7-bisphosphate phosphatase|nr:HAD family hydrolase [Acidobacteriota bacterium]